MGLYSECLILRKLIFNLLATALCVSVLTTGMLAVNAESADKVVTAQAKQSISDNTKKNTTTQTKQVSVEEVKQNIIKQAKQMGVDPAIVLSIAKAESGFNQSAKSACGTHIGVFQLSHSAAKNMGLDPYKLDDNIKGGITYYKNMYKMFGSMELAVAAYNSGPVAIKRHNNTVPHHSKHFVSRIMADYKTYKAIGI
jgi:soluble lytic murein transglycosylase-like protein